MALIFVLITLLEAVFEAISITYKHTAICSIRLAKKADRIPPAFRWIGENYSASFFLAS
jgi:hypothetical protein